jgi:hypothetical protein
MCAELSSYAKNLCNQYRNGTLTQTKLNLYRQVGKITQAEYDSILDTECPCGWIVPSSLAAPVE